MIILRRAADDANERPAARLCVLVVACFGATALGLLAVRPDEMEAVNPNATVREVQVENALASASAGDPEAAWRLLLHPPEAWNTPPLPEECAARPAARDVQATQLEPFNESAARRLATINAAALCGVSGLRGWTCGRCGGQVQNVTLITSRCTPGEHGCDRFWAASDAVSAVEEARQHWYFGKYFQKVTAPGWVPGKYYSEAVTKSATHGDGSVLAAVLVEPERRWVVVAFRGTRDADAGAWMINFDCKQEGLVGGDACVHERVHHGWHEAWRQLRRRVRAALESLLAALPGYRLVITGHSIGSALATLMIDEWLDDGTLPTLSARSQPPLLLTFAGPRVGNAAFADALDAALARHGLTLFRVVNQFDLIPRIPNPSTPGGGEWQHAGVQVWLTPESGGAVAKVCGLGELCHEAAPSFRLNMQDHTSYFGVSSAGSGC